jgi:hypothetical protein
MPISYENFDIEVARDQHGYVVRARSLRGEARADFHMPLTEQEVRILGLTVARGRGTSRSVQTRDVDEVKAYGQRLFDSLLSGDVLACYHENLAHVRRSTHTGLRVRLRLTDAPELAEVPWEYLFDRRNSRFLALEDETPIVRYLDLPLPARPLVVEPPMRVLVMISSPEDVPRLDANQEWQRLDDALADLVQQGAVRLDRLDRATLTALRWRLKEDEYHVFHFIGHGGPGATHQGVLILEDAARRSDVVDAEVIAGIISPEKTLRLAVLNACEGAGTARELVKHDVPAVIAMQFEISDDAAITLTHDFYKALAYGDPVDAALTEARRGLRYERRNELEWGTPVLYMRASDGRLFDVKTERLSAATSQPPAQQPPAPRRVVSEVRFVREVRAEPDPGGVAVHEPVREAARDTPREPSRDAVPDPPRAPVRTPDRRIAELIHASQVASFAERWEEATARLAEVLQLDPAHQEAARLLEEVRREEQLAVLYRTGADHESAGQVGAAIDAFQRARDLAGRDYRDVDARIKVLREGMKAKPARRKVLWVRIGKFAVGMWVLGILAMIVMPNDPTQLASSPGDFPAVGAGGSGSPVSVTPPTADTAAAIIVGEPPSRPTAAAPQRSTPDGIRSRDAEAAALGLSPHGRPRVGTLAADQWDVHNLTLEPGAYAIAASCDDFCSDLDLTVMEQGAVVVQDVQPGDTPNVNVIVVASGTYQLRVDMAGCSRAGCGYRVQVYR